MQRVFHKYLEISIFDIKSNDTLANPTKAINWTKSTSEAFCRYDDTANLNGVNGVKHCYFTELPDGTEDWIVFHVKNPNENSWSFGKSTFIQKFKWKTDGTLDFGTPVGWGETVVLPSGENQ